MLYCRLYTIFQSTLPREERHFSLHVVSSISIFQSTLPREERPKFSDFFPILLIYFNPRSHERSDIVVPVMSSASTISIHAPTRGATSASMASSSSKVISIHAPTRGATVHKLSGLLLIHHFNPRSHERSDGLVLRLPPPHSYFNPRSHERSDKKSKYRLNGMGNFNPRSHERSDSNIAQKICLFLYNTDNKYIIR